MPAGAYEQLQRIARSAGKREACALLLGRSVGENVFIDGIVGARNTRRTRHSFGISRAVLASMPRTPIGLFHTHARTPHPSPADAAACHQITWLEVQIIGVLCADGLVCRAFGFDRQERSLQWL